jgi:hypothetical protein
MKTALTLLMAGALGIALGLSGAHYWPDDPAPTVALVRARSNNTPMDIAIVEKERTAAAVQWLVQTNLWGMQRNGLAPAPKALAAASATKLVAWRLISIVSRPQNRAILVQESDTGEIREIAQGALLPDGGTLTRISAASITVQKGTAPSRIISVSALTQSE